MNPTLILASGSPRRRDFIGLLDIPFQIHIADIDESRRAGESPTDLVTRLSREKAQAVTRRFPQATIIGADTIVVLEDDILGKPVDADHAADMLRRLRDCAHHVYSGVTVCANAGNRHLTAVSDSLVWMRPYSDAELAAYIASSDPLDKAGAYGIQHAGFHPVSRLKGCFASVMGLPLCHLVDLLEQMEFSISIDVPTACQSLTDVSCCGGQSVEMWFETQNFAKNSH
ncbi:MAG: septum formation protein Maf [Anaerolineae bacterium]|nr:septum formation protein Maf [Anaerolineae bacterium]